MALWIESRPCNTKVEGSSLSFGRDCRGGSE